VMVEGKAGQVNGGETLVAEGVNGRRRDPGGQMVADLLDG
jgi:hypothetical protein